VHRVPLDLFVGGSQIGHQRPHQQRADEDVHHLRRGHRPEALAAIPGAVQHPLEQDESVAEEPLHEAACLLGPRGEVGEPARHAVAHEDIVEDVCLEPLEGEQIALQGSAVDRRHVPVPALDDPRDHVGDLGEPAIEGGRGRSRAAGDLVDGHRTEPLLGNELGGGVDQGGVDGRVAGTPPA
jgi:hypothetical protein